MDNDVRKLIDEIINRKGWADGDPVTPEGLESLGITRTIPVSSDAVLTNANITITTCNGTRWGAPKLDIEYQRPPLN